MQWSTKHCQPGGDPTAEELLQRMAKAYAECRSYRDTGVVETVYSHDDGKRNVTRKPFSTAFVRPDRFRFEYTEDEDQYDRNLRMIIWRNGEEVRTWWDVTHEIEQPGSLGLAVGGATGVSGASAHTIPALLLPDEIGGRHLARLEKPIRVTDAMQGEIACFRIEGAYAGNPMALWLDKDTCLVRRVTKHRVLSDCRTETTTTYEPAIGVEVTEDLLAFDPAEHE